MGKRKKTKKVIVKKSKRCIPRIDHPKQDSEIKSKSFFQPPDHWLLKQFWPKFAELPVGLMSFALILSIALDIDVLNFILKGIKPGEEAIKIPAFIIFAIIIIIPIFYVFIDDNKSSRMKKLLVNLGAIYCIVAGVAGGYNLMNLRRASLIIWLFGIFNIIQGGFLFILFRLEILDENSFSDQQPPLLGAIANFGIVFFLFLILKFTHKLVFIDYFAILVAFSMTFSSAVCRLTNRLEESV